MICFTNVILFIFILIIIIYNYNKIFDYEYFNTDKIYNNIIPQSSKINFEYDKYNNNDCNKQYLIDQEFGVNQKTWYPNTWIQKIVNDKPVYKCRDNIEPFVEAKARFTYEFNRPKFSNMDGIADPDDFIDGQGRTLKEVYDNSFVNFKKLIPNKTLKDTEDNYIECASNLKTYNTDTWIYENEKLENGGHIANNLYAMDPSNIETFSIF
jgi:hypothetical protein